MKYPILYSFVRCPYAMRARMALQLANIKCEIREVRLNNKPEYMLAASPKGTVPILILEERVIDESIEIINWALIQDHNLFDDPINSKQMNLTNDLIKLFDENFKFHLDRYKYSTRYDNPNEELHRSKCLEILISLENIISDSHWIFGKTINKLDISILPFIRQFRIADSVWFDSLLEIKKVQKLLNQFLDSELFKTIMYKYDVWDDQNEPVYFPATIL